MDHTEIIEALSFAQNYLNIKEKNFIHAWQINPELGSGGIYYPDLKIIYFGNFLNLNTIFHESVHYWQDENKRCIPNFRRKFYSGIVAYYAYIKDPIEMEARNLANEMTIKYRDKRNKINGNYYYFNGSKYSIY